MLVALDDDGARWAAHAGLACVRFDPDPSVLESAETLVLGPTSLVHLRGLRATGNRVPAVLVGMAPDRRAELEPVAVVSDDDDALVVLAELTERSHAGAVPVHDGTVDVQRRCLYRDGARLPMTQLQVDLLAYLAHRRDRPVPREELLVHVWGMSAKSRTRTVDMAMSRLRKLVERDPLQPAILLTCQGSGYRYVPPPLAEVEPEDEAQLLGRKGLLQELGRAVQTLGMVVIHGVGGVGKSEVANAFARRRSATVISLEGVHGATDGAAAIAAALGVGAPDVDSPRGLLEHAFATAAQDLVIVDGADGIADMLTDLGEARGATRVVVALRIVPPSWAGARLAVAPLDDASALLLLQRLGPHDLQADALLKVVKAVGGLPLGLIVAAPRVGALGADAATNHLLAASGEGPVPRAIRGSIGALTTSAQQALGALGLGRVPIGPGDLTQILGRDAVEDWVTLHVAGLVRVNDGHGALLPPVWEVLQGTPVSADTRGRYRDWLFGRIQDLADQLGTAASTSAIDELGLLHGDGWRLVQAHPDTAAASVAACTLDALAEWRGAPRTQRRARITSLLEQAHSPAARQPLLARRAEITPNADFEQVHRDLDEAARHPCSPEVAGRLASRRARVADWSREPEAAITHIDQALQAELPKVLSLTLRAQRTFLRARHRKQSIAEASGEVVGIFEQLQNEGALQASLTVATLALTLLRVSGSVSTEERLAFAQQALRLAERMGESSVIATMHLRVGECLTALGRKEETLQTFADADELFGRIEPLQRLQVAASLGRVLTEWGDHSAARHTLRRYLHWSQSRGLTMNVADAALWLVSVEGDAGDPAAMLAYAEQAVSACGGSDRHLGAHAVLGAGHALLLARRLEEAASRLNQVVVGDLSPVGVVGLRTCQCVLARLQGQSPSEFDPALEVAVAEGQGRYWDAVRAISSQGIADSPAPMPVYGEVEERLMVRTWRLWLDRPPSNTPS